MRGNSYIIGLKDSVSQLLYEDGYVVTSRYNSLGEFVGSSMKEQTVLVANKIQYGVIDDPNGNEISVYKYVFSDGGAYYEEYQPYSYQGEDYLFCAFRDDDGDWVPESLWTREEMLDKIMENTSIVV